MSSSRDVRREVTPKVVAASLFFCTTTIIFLNLRIPLLWGDILAWQHLARTAVGVSGVVFSCAGVLIFFRPRFGYILGLVAGLIAMPWFVWSELALEPSWNSWTALIYAPGDDAFTTLMKTLMKWRILSVASITVAAACAALRLVPARLRLRKIPYSRRTWPAFALGFVVLTGWFVHSATPYLVPVCTRGVPPEFQILHVRKSGLRIQQTVVAGLKDGRVVVERYDKRLFQYRFEYRTGWGVMPYEVLLAFAQSPELWKRHSQVPKCLLRSWNAG